MYVIRCGNEYFLNQRPSTGLLANLFEFYNEIGDSFSNCKGEIVETYVHIFSHIEWHMQVYVFDVKEKMEGIWVSKDEFLKYPIASAFEPCKKFVV